MLPERNVIWVKEKSASISWDDDDKNLNYCVSAEMPSTKQTNEKWAQI